MRLLVLGLNYAPEPVGIGPYTRGAVEALAAAGHRVELVCAKPYYPAWTVDPAFAQPGWRRERNGGVSVLRCPLYVPRRPSGARRIAHHVSFALAAIGPMLAAARRGPAVVMVVAPSLLSVPVAWAAARLAHAPLWVHVQDFEVEAAFATGLVPNRGLLSRCARWAESRLLRSAALVSTISPQMRRKLIDKGVDPTRTRELRNWAESDLRSTPDGVAHYRAEWRLGDRHVALYSGNLGTKQGLDILIDAARRLANRDDIVMVICGDGAGREALSRAVAGLSNVQLHALQPRARMGDLLALASVHLLPQLPGAADLVLPSKLTNMLASGRPVVATAVAGTGLSDEVEGCGAVTPPGDAGALAKAIASLIDDPSRRTSLGACAKRRAQERWSREVLLARFVDTAEQLAGGLALRPRSAGHSGANAENEGRAGRMQT